MPEGPAASAEHRLPTRSGARAVLLAVPLALLTLGLAECLHVPWLVYARAPARCVPIALFVYSRELAVLAPNLAFQLALAALCARAVLRGKSLRAQASACAVLALAPVAFAYAVLIRDPVFIRYPPLYAGLLALLAYLAGSALWLVNDMELPHAPRWLAKLRLPWTALAFLAAGAVHAANLRLYVDDYPTLHAAALACTYLLLHAGIALLLATARGGALAGSLSARAWTALAIGTLLPGLLGATLPAIAAVRPFVYAHTLSGRASLVPGREIEPIAPRRVEVPNAEAYFLAHSHLPTLPADFSLARNNVLLITSEATRFDQTSFANPRTGLTPNLRKWQRDAHAFWFSQAYSASCSTGQSMASLLSMTFPSAARWQVWRKRWNGELLPEADSLPEVFARGGYKTFWISHNHRTLFGSELLGFPQGFAETRLFPSSPNQADSDAQIANAAIRRLQHAAHDKQPFFGWVFFVSPHRGYVTHGYDMPQQTDLQRYRQEIRYLDEQLGRVLHALDQTGLAKRTVVLYMGDHGEQFGEHGGTDHSRNLYTESIHVPLLVKVPGVEGGALREPVSTTYLFPWLLLHGPAALSSAASERIRRELAPLMSMTGGAVLAELLGSDRNLASLVYRNRQLHYDFATGAYEVYDLSKDRGEHRDLVDERPAAAARQAPHLDAYRQLRAATHRFTLDPTRSPIE